MQRDTFQMVALTDFGWDFMLVVSPHASGAKVAEEYGFKLGEISPQSIDLSMRDNAAILLFISGGNAIAYCEYPIKCGDFSDLSKGANLFIAQHSCFAIDTASNQMRLVPCR